VVVMLIDRMRQNKRGTQPSLPRVSVLLAGISILPTQSGGISLLPAGAQLHAIDELRTGLQATETKPLSYLEFVPPAGQLEPSLKFGFSWSGAELPQTQGSEPAVTALLNSTVSASSDEFGVGGGAMGSVLTARAVAPAWTPISCEQLGDQLQTGGRRWNRISTSNTPVQLAENASAHRIQGSISYPSNLPSQSPGAAWCRPGPLQFASSGPLANPAFWTPIAVVLFGVAVLWLSRGVNLPP
jgi:hypothetical protein